MKKHNQHLPDENSQVEIESAIDEHEQFNSTLNERQSQSGPKHVVSHLIPIFVGWQQANSEEDKNNVSNQND